MGDASRWSPARTREHYFPAWLEKLAKARGVRSTSVGSLDSSLHAASSSISLPASTPRLRKTSLLIYRDRHPLRIPGPKSLHLWAGGQIWPTWEPQQATIWPGTPQAGMYGRGFLHTTKQAGSLLKPGI